MDWLVSWLRDEKDVIKRAPFLTVLFILFGGLLGWSSRALYDDHHIDSLQDIESISHERLAFCETQLAKKVP